ncbi:hypothetical protein GCM10018785_38750 [Streptomyces longispororuber]|uniref:WXG100 family type VII secretion target n=1 Tax=Streptomyces longispororuber TaxID=68230 RepID=A0A918ZR12_9ACTN|nr:hypothetical protein [Streptomyces longispororuber]GHE66218.1 hypothetical protein GCM10018785_38750 [Streptomyces longispororuber]
MKFDMGETTLATLGKQTSGSSDDLGALIRALVSAAEPLEGKFNGAGKATFDAFKLRVDDITADLNGSLRSILGGQAGMDEAFATGTQEQSDNANRNMGAANFQAARFSG